MTPLTFNSSVATTRNYVYAVSGAIEGAYGYVLNECVHRHHCRENGICISKPDCVTKNCRFCKECNSNCSKFEREAPGIPINRGKPAPLPTKIPAYPAELKSSTLIVLPTMVSVSKCTPNARKPSISLSTMRLGKRNSGIPYFNTPPISKSVPFFAEQIFCAEKY